ncbi:MAG TPA: ATP-binding protein [Solirubrobacteraceae bacterium]|jgi:signal transduction histidine kinase|nr:ATP-binding protein [Solirubrobacteraceae bacterium]
MSLLRGGSARRRLALIYSASFLALGTVVIIVILFAERSGSTVAVANPTIHVVTHRRQLLQPVLISGPAFVSAQHSADITRLAVICWIVLLLTAIVAFPLGWLASGRMLKPLREITARTRTISAGNLHERLALAGGRDEFTELGATLDDLFARLESAFDAQRRFVANASHELRTPLTLERTLLQVALADPDATAATLRAACEELLSNGREQERLIEALLTLARSERGLERRERTDLGALAARVLERPLPELEQHGIELDSELEPAITEGDPALIERLITNLLENAVRHNIDGGRIVISTRQQGDRAVLHVENSGQMIAFEEIETMFEPFRRLGPARTGPDSGQHGLGLSIVRAVAEAHHAEIDARPRAGGGLTITVAFRAPQAPA